MQEGDLQWVGSEGHRIAFCFEPDLDLMREDLPEPTADDDEASSPMGSAETGDLARLFSDPGGRYSFTALLTRSPHPRRAWPKNYGTEFGRDC